MALGSIHPVTEMSTRNISWGQRRPVPKADNLPPSCFVVTKSGSLNFLEPSRPVQACNGTALPLPYVLINQYYVPLLRQDFSKFVTIQNVILNFSVKYLVKTRSKFMVTLILGQRTSIFMVTFFYFFCWRYNPLWVLAFSVIFFHSVLSLLTFLHPLIPIVWISSSTSSIQLFLDLPLILLPIGFHSNILLGILPPSTLNKVNKSLYRPEVLRGFQEVKVPRLHDNSPEWW